MSKNYKNIEKLLYNYNRNTHVEIGSSINMPLDYMSEYRLKLQRGFFKKIIASNISCIIHFILYIVILILINLYFSYYSETLKLLIMIINLIMLSMSIGNLLLITNKDTIIFNIKNNKGASKQKAIIQFIKQILISLFLGIILYWILYKFNSIVLFPLILVIYILSLIVNQKINCYTNK